LQIFAGHCQFIEQVIHQRKEESVDPVFSVASFILGAVVGSFLNVVILRLPTEGESIVFPPSRCPRCKAEIRWFDNIPLLSYLILGGRCRSCRTRISLQYPLVELCMALLSLALYTKLGLSFEFFFYFLFLAALVAIIFIDIAHQIIPNTISLPGILIGFAGSFINSEVTWQQAGLGVLLGGGVLYVIAESYYLLTKRDGMGGGDIKLLAMIGAFLGWQSLLFVVFASSLSGSLIGIAAMIKQGKGGKTRIPFGPFLAFAAMLFLFYQAEIFRWWVNYSTTGALF
jgi:leader peptidase (prepilin peptidase) / N-methyltransferase